jgi:predicted RecA/RadA family phage recombinase
MGDYTPLFKPGEDITMTAGADILGGDLVYVSASRTVQKTAGAVDDWLGIARYDAKAGEQVTITSGGVQELAVAAAVVPGDVIIPAASGRGTPIAAGTNYAQVVGIALTGQSTVGQTAYVRFVR